MVFALHPVQVESVAWISGMKDVLAGLLGLTSACQYLAATERPGNQGSNSSPSIVWHRYALALALAAFAMLSKPSAVALPLVLIAIDVGWRRYPWRISLVRLIPFFVLAAPVIAIGKAAQPAANLDYVPPVYLRPLVAIDALGFYLGKTALPIGLGIDYGRSPRWLFQTPGIKWAGLIAVMAWAFAVAVWRRWRAPGVGLLLFTAALLPTLGLIPFDYQAYSTVADHYLYLAMIGPGLVAGTLLLGKPPLTQALPRQGVAAVAIIAMAGLSFAQTRHWHDSHSLFRHTLRVNPASLAANVNLGNLLAEQGRTDEAIACFSSAIAAAPQDYHANLNLANMLRLKGMLAEAENHYRTAAHTRLGTTSAQTWTTLGAVQAMQKRYDDAIESFHRALSIDPAYGPAKQNLDLALKLRPITPATRPS
jgi:Tfp pilus assembly protein PilF